jgi:hypothetical protein
VTAAPAQAHPDATVELTDGPGPVRARAAEGAEQVRLWVRWRDMGDRSGETLGPRHRQAAAVTP